MSANNSTLTLFGDKPEKNSWQDSEFSISLKCCEFFSFMPRMRYVSCSFHSHISVWISRGNHCTFFSREPQFVKRWLRFHRNTYAYGIRNIGKKRYSQVNWRFFRRNRWKYTDTSCPPTPGVEFQPTSSNFRTRCVNQLRYVGIQRKILLHKLRNWPTHLVGNVSRCGFESV